MWLLADVTQSVPISTAAVPETIPSVREAPIDLRACRIVSSKRLESVARRSWFERAGSSMTRCLQVNLGVDRRDDHMPVRSRVNFDVTPPIGLQAESVVGRLMPCRNVGEKARPHCAVVACPRAHVPHLKVFGPWDLLAEERSVPASRHEEHRRRSRIKSSARNGTHG